MTSLLTKRNENLAQTDKQKIGDLGETYAQSVLNKSGGCITCEHKRGRIKKCGNSFAAVDLICEFCFQAYQVKTTAQNETSTLPRSVRGAQYPPLYDRKENGIFHPLIIVVFKKGKGGPCRLVRSWRATASIWYLSAEDVANHFDELFVPYHTVIKKGAQAGRKLEMTTITINDKVKDKFVELNAVTYVEPFVGGGAVLFDLLSARTPASPVLKWAGGKKKLLPAIRKRLPKSSVPFHRTIRRYVVFDINPELVLCYNILKLHVDSLISEIKKLSDSYPYWDKMVDKEIPEKRKEYYYSIREQWNSNVGKPLTLQQQIQRAAQTIFLNRTCFNGLFRVNKKGEFNVPIGSYANPRILYENDLINASAALKNVEIIHGQYYESERYVDEKSFVYFDPPYRPLAKGASFTTYTKSGFNDTNQIQLANFFSSLSTRGARLMLSNSDPKNESKDDEFFDELYSPFHIQRVTTIHAINSHGKGRTPITEILVTNYR